MLAFLCLIGLTDSAEATESAALATARAAATGLGQNRDAAQAASKAYQTAPSPAHRAQSARLAAAARFRDDRFMQAEWWLRRAANDADDPALRTLIAREFAQVRQANPLSIEASLSFAPSSNINNGSTNDTIYIWDLPFTLSADAQALSGYEATMGLGLGYRLSENTDHLTEVGLAFFGRAFALSDAAKRSAPEADASDYSFGVIEAFINHQQLIFPEVGVSALQGLIGQNWYGGDPLTRYARLALAQDFRLTDRSILKLQANTEYQDALDGGADIRVSGLDGAVTQVLGSGDVFRASLGTRRARSDDPAQAYRSVRAGLRYGLRNPVLGARLSFDLGAEHRDYDASPFASDGRRDRSLSAAVTAVLDNVEYFGFSPSLSLEAHRTRSNISLYERETLGLRLGFQSNF